MYVYQECRLANNNEVILIYSFSTSYGKITFMKVLFLLFSVKSQCCFSQLSRVKTRKFQAFRTLGMNDVNLVISSVPSKNVYHLICPADSHLNCTDSAF